MSVNQRVLASVIVIGLLIAGSYVLESLTREYGVRSGSIIKVTNDGADAALMSPDVISEMAAKNTNDDDASAQISLHSFLAAAGINDYSIVEVSGLKSEKVFRVEDETQSDDVVLRVTDRGTVSLFRSDVTDKPLIEDVNAVHGYSHK